MAQHQFTTVRTADILDQLCEAVDAAREQAAGNQRWLNAVNAAWGWLLEQDSISFDLAASAIRVESVTEAGRVYIANGSCGCPAFASGNACWHRACARLVRRALERRAAAELNALAQELVNDAHAAGCSWYGAAEGLAGARMRADELADVAAEWDSSVAAQRAALGARIGRAQAAAMARPLAA